jgi:molybdopterin synthase catalytic subunit/molybdopterin synthase sulfur carrier subunit
MRVLFFSHLKDVTGHSAVAWSGVPSMDADGLWSRLGAAYPGIERFRASTRLARNGEYARPETRFGPGDEVALIPPVSGG